MKRAETTENLARLTERRIRRRCRLWAPEVEVPEGGRVDFMGFSPYGERPDAPSIERGELWCRGIVGPPVEPDGFCAWGSTREVD